MKQLSWLVLGLLLMSHGFTSVAAARGLGIKEGKTCRTTKATSAAKTCRKGLFCNSNTHRCARLGSLDAPCKKASTDCKLVANAVCYQQQCYGATARPKKAPCAVDSHCTTGYCGVAGRCALQHLDGNFCRRPQQCVSGACDTVAARCVASQELSRATTAPTTATSTTASITKGSSLATILSPSSSSSSLSTSSSSSSSSAASSTPASVAARAAYASATPVSDSQSYSSTSSSSSHNQPMLVQRTGQISKVGDVIIISSDTANTAIRFVADSTTPAALKQVPDTPLTGTPITLRFHYAVTALQASSGQCSVIAFVNEEQLMPSLAITASAQTDTAAFPYTNTAPVTSYAVTVVCDGTSAGTTLQLDTLTTTVDPPTCDASTPDCGFEAGSGTSSSPSKWTGVASGQSIGDMTSSPEDVHTGLSAYQCVVAVEGDRCGLKRSVSASSLTPGTTYTLTFWSKSTPQDSAPPTVRVGKSSATYFNGKANLVATSIAGNNNGFRQYTATFVLPNDSDQTDLKVQVGTTAAGTYDYDDFALTPASAAPLDGGLPSGQCSGLNDCGFEGAGCFTIIDANGNTDPRALCTVTTQDAFVRSGQQAQLCTITAPNDQSFVYLQGGGEHAYVVGSSYVWTFWVQLSGGATASSLKCNIWANNGDGALAYQGACPITTATPVNGFQQVAVPFTAPSAQMSFMIALSDVGQYAFDDVSMLDGAIPAITYDVTSPPLATGSDNAAFLQTCVGGLTNCDFETGYANGYALQVGPSSSCAVTTEPTDVHAGTYALRCDTTTADASGALEIAPETSSVGLLAGTRYVVSVWAKSGAASGGGVGANGLFLRVDGSASTVSMQPANNVAADANGFIKYAATFTASADTDHPSIAVVLITPGLYHLDTFALTLTPLPFDTSACSGMPDCSFEQVREKNADADRADYLISGGQPFRATTGGYSALHGQSAMLGVPDQYGAPLSAALLESDTSASGSSLAVGDPYVWTFWTKNTFRTSSLTCVVWERSGAGALAYNGTCPITTAPAINGFRQVAIAFTASDAYMDVMIKVSAPPSPRQSLIAVDDFSFVPGRFAIQYDLTAGPPLTIGSSSSIAPQTPTCSGFHNCGFESGFENGFVWEYSDEDPSPHVECGVTSDSVNVYQGSYALQCACINFSGDTVSFSPLPSVPILEPMVTYTLSFWYKDPNSQTNVPRSSIYLFGRQVSDDSEVEFVQNGQLQVLTGGGADTNGFMQLGFSFAVQEQTRMHSRNQIRLSGMPSVFFFDNFDLSSS